MKCVSCNAEIPPAFVAAIQKNICPGCDGPIMTEDSKKLMDDLKEAMVKMPNDPEGLAGWLLSTYDLFPKGTVEPTSFHRKGKQKRKSADEDDVEMGETGEGLRLANTTTNEIMKLAKLDRIQTPKTKQLAKLARKARQVDEDLYGDDEEEDEDLEIDEEDEEVSMLEMIQQAKATSKKKKKKPTMAQLMANEAMIGDGSMSPSDFAKIQAMVGGFGGSGMDNDDAELDGIENLPPALQADRLARLQKQRELSYGGSIGMIKRNG